MESTPSLHEDGVERTLRVAEPGIDKPAEGSAWTGKTAGKDGRGKGGEAPTHEPMSSRMSSSFLCDDAMGFFDLPGEHSGFHGPLGNMNPSDFISRPQRHCPETWEATMSISESWPTQKAEDTGRFREIGFFGASSFTIKMFGNIDGRRTC